MSKAGLSRRAILERIASISASGCLPAAIAKAVEMPALSQSGTIGDVHHVVIVMLENRSFDHYFGSLRGVRGFGDRHPIPRNGGRTVWDQADGAREIRPFHLDSHATSALKVQSTPHTFADAQAAWGQGQLDTWPVFKTPISMGHYQRSDIPFQFALADAFTVCDAHHCSVTTGTDPNRIMFWSGSNFDPIHRARGENCTDTDAEVNNLRCLISGSVPEPGYTYQGSALPWPTIPDVLEMANISWRVYQDPNDNWTGLMHGGLAFASFRDAKPGSPIYERGMRHWSLEQLAEDVRQDRLPQVSWILPSQAWSEHPAGSSPMQGGEFTSRVLDALTANSEVWGRTVLFLTFDENDGLFDHAPPPAPPSYNADGTLAGDATLNLDGLYFSDPDGKYIHPDDPIRSKVRPWGLGPRVPMYVISPWSKGGWVNSQVFDHTSVGQFIEKRFGVTIPAISPWHRAVSGDLTSCFDFAGHGQRIFPKLPRIRNSAALVAAAERKSEPHPPVTPEPLFQERGIRASRALPYALEVDSAAFSEAELQLTFCNEGQAGAVFHVYDRLHLDRIPRRYTVEAGRTLDGRWDSAADQGHYDLWVYGPNGFVREFVGQLRDANQGLGVGLRYDTAGRALVFSLTNRTSGDVTFHLRPNAYRTEGPWRIAVKAGQQATKRLSLSRRHNWYDFSVTADGLQRRFSGRVETGTHDISDPALI